MCFQKVFPSHTPVEQSVSKNDTLACRLILKLMVCWTVMFTSLQRVVLGRSIQKITSAIYNLTTTFFFFLGLALSSNLSEKWSKQVASR